MKQHKAKIITATALALLLGYLYYESSSVDTHEHLQVSSQLQQLRQLDESAERYVLQARMGLLANYDPLVMAQQQMHEIANQLREQAPELFAKKGTELTLRFEAYMTARDAKELLLNQFKTQNAILKNSTLYFPEAAELLLNGPGHLKEGDVLEIEIRDHLLSKLQEYQVAPSYDALDAILQAIARISLRKNSYTPLQQQQMATLLKHAQIIVDYKFLLDHTLPAITEIPTIKLSVEVFDLYNAWFAQAEHEAALYRFWMMMFALSGLIYGGYLLININRAHQKLNRSITELEFQKYALDQHSIVSVADRSGKITYANPKFCEISQYSLQELMGQDHRLLNSGYHSSEFFRQMWLTIGHGQVWHGEVKNRRKDGSYYWVDATIVPSIGEDGKPLRYVSIRSDITERKLIDEELETQRAFYERISETMGEGLFVQDASGCCSYLNSEAERLLGWSRAELVGKNVHDIIHPTAADGSAISAQNCPIMLAVNNQGEALLSDQVFTRKDGTSFPVELVSKAIINSNNSSEGMVVSFKDISERKQNEELIRLTQERLNLALEGSGQALWDWDIAADRIYLSKTWFEMLGAIETDRWTSVESIFAITHPQDLAKTKATLAEALKGAIPFYEIEYRIRHNDGRWIWVHTQGKVVGRNGDGRATRMTGTTADITLRKQAEAAITLGKEAAEQANRAKSDFLANMSHEIRTPMNGIIGMTELALDTELTADQREYLGMVKSSADSLLSIVNDILDFSKIEAGKMNLDNIDFCFPDMMTHAARSIALRAHQKGLELALDIAPDIPEMLFGDPGRLRQIVINLIGNSIKFTNKGEIVVKVTLAESQPHSDPVRLHLSVRDTGIGIPADKFQAIFESFSQADTSTTRQYGGTGLGLTISSRLVELMHGHIWVESEVGKGSNFHVEIELGRSGEQCKPHFESGRLHGIRTLVVDDNQTNRELAVDLLRRWNMAPYAVERGRQAIEELYRANLQNEGYQLILLDLQMPDMSGFDVVEHLRTHPELAVAPIMMLTSEGQRGDAARCRELGIAAYLLKPYSQADLFRAIMTTLGFADVDNAPLVTRHLLKHNKHNLHILLAEDNAVNQTLAVRLLNKFGHIVVIANNGLEAVAKWQGGEFDLILMDVDMPELNGYDATTQIRSHEKQRGGHIPIVGLTAHAMQGVREECLRQGMDGYLSKPIDTEALWIELESIMAAKPVVNQLMIATDSDFSFSMDKALALMDNDMELFCEMVKIYVEDAPGYMDKLGQAIEQGDCNEIKHLAHTIKGMVSIFAVPAVAKIAGRIELSESGDYHQDYDELKQALQWLTETLSVAVAAVETE